jgi:hypothetical protein
VISVLDTDSRATQIAWRALSRFLPL